MAWRGGGGEGRGQAPSSTKQAELMGVLRRPGGEGRSARPPGWMCGRMEHAEKRGNTGCARAGNKKTSQEQNDNDLKSVGLNVREDQPEVQFRRRVDAAGFKETVQLKLIIPPLEFERLLKKRCIAQAPVLVTFTVVE